jgi:alpha-aminoadipate/glutamate carrier protein LysW
MATCPECDAEVEVDETDVDLGDEVSCPECGQTLVISNTDPFELDFAPDDEDEDEDDDEKVDEDEDEDEEEEDEEDGADWEEE